MSSITFIIRYCLFSCLGVISPLLHAQELKKNCQVIYRGDQELTGNVQYVPVLPLKLLWTYKTGDVIRSSPVICNGIVYIGSSDGTIYAITLGGQLKWKYQT